MKRKAFIGQKNSKQINKNAQIHTHLFKELQVLTLRSSDVINIIALKNPDRER